MKITIIPAIGNSRRIKSKNIKGVIILKFSTVDINDKENCDFTGLFYKDKKSY